MRVGVLLVCFGAQACMPSAYRTAKKLEGNYIVGNPGDGWSAQPAGGADHAWYSRTLGATIYTDSNCGPRYREVDPSDLSTELVAGIRERALLRDEAYALSDREGVLRVFNGTMDGVLVQVGTLVFNKDWCTYDMALISAPDTFDAGWSAYERVLRGFEPK